jgi:ABC-type transport system involved in multi-copper enzyme maturation permease subunit
MIRALFFRSIRQHAVLLAMLCLSLFLLEFFLVWVAAQMDLGPEFRQLLETILPPEITEMIFGQFSFSSFEGAVAFGYQHPFSLVACIAMIVVAVTIPAAEREKGLLDLFLARPVPRTRYLLATLSFFLFSALLLPMALLGGTAVGLRVVDTPSEVGWLEYLPSALVLALLLLSLGSLTLLLATGARRRGVAVAQGVGLTLLFYWLDFMGEYWEVLETARKGSPFFYFDPGMAAMGSEFPATDFLVLGAITALASSMAFLNFQRQDL